MPTNCSWQWCIQHLLILQLSKPELHQLIINNPKYYFLLNSIGVGTVAGTIFIKYWIYLWSNRLAKKYDSNVLYANALHHRADALSSIVALVGLCGRVFEMQKVDV